MAKKKVVVNKKFLNDLANWIYDPAKKSFLRLCSGTLQNGPDPEDEERSMHCGLGELYFAIPAVNDKGCTDNSATAASALPASSARQRLCSRSNTSGPK